MLKYLDGYPLELPSRYMNKYACYTQVFIISNIPLIKQYPAVQLNEFESWLAFTRRINLVHEHVDGKIKQYDIKPDKDGFRLVLFGEIPNEIGWR